MIRKPRIFLNNIQEDWIVDRLRKEWYLDNRHLSTLFKSRANIVWLIAPWGWKKLNKSLLKNKKVVCTIHHIDESKFKEEDHKEFYERDFFVDVYHVVSLNTFNQVKKLTDKKIFYIPFWVNFDIWFPKNDKKQLKLKYGFNDSSFLIGSFQRDSEGKNVNLPKLSKGPDRFLEIIKSLNQNKDITVVLTGRRRNYLINEFQKEGIKFKTFEMMKFSSLNELYNCLDLYIVASRYEGGPQSILECAATKTPIISTNVGIASEILEPKSIFTMDTFNSAKPDTDYAYRKVLELSMNKIYPKFNSMFDEVISM